MVAIQRSLDQSVRRVLRQIFLLMGGLVVVAFVGWLVYGQFVLSRLHTVYQDRVVPLRDLTLVSHIVNVQIPQRYLDGGYEDDPTGQKLLADWDRIEVIWRHYMQTYLTPAEADLAGDFRRSLDELRDHLAMVGPEYSVISSNEGEVYSRMLRTFNQRAAALNELQVDVALQNLRQASNVTQWAVVAAVLLAALLLVLALYAHHIIGQRVVAPVEWVARSLQRLAEGDVAHQRPRFPLSAEFSDLLGEMERVRSFVGERQSLLQEEQQTSRRLRDTQAELVEAEKLASLGSLVAGVAHELNTPIGVAVAVSSSLEEKRKTFLGAVGAGGLKRSVLDAFVADVQQAGELLSHNLERAASLVRSFKQVAVDRAGTQRRRFDLAQTVDEVLASLRPSLRGRGIELVNEVPPGTVLDSYPGAWGQVITNLLNNAVLHAFADGVPVPAQGWRVGLALAEAPVGQVRLRVSDNGAGMDGNTQARIFEPFFTTRLGQGGSGLGMSIVRNIVIGLLGGRVQVHSQPGHGTTVDIQVPFESPRREAGVSQESVIYAVR